MTPKASAVIDANVVIGLSKGNCFPLLKSLFNPLYVPRGVEHEVVVLGRDRPGSRQLRQAIADGWAMRATPIAAQPMMTRDEEVIAVAQQYSVEYVLTGDEEVASMARELELKHLSAPEIVALLKLAGVIPSAQLALDVMISNGFGIDPAQRQQILALVGEA